MNRRAEGNHMSDEQKFVGVTRSVVEKYLDDLHGAGVEVNAIDRLRETLLKQGKISEKHLRQALFNPE